MTLEKKKKQMEEISKKIKSLYELRSTNKREKTSLLVSIRSMKDQVINTEKEIRHQEKMLLNCQISHQKIEDNITQIVGRIHYYRVSISIGNISSESKELLGLEDDLRHLEEEFEIASTNYNAFESTEEALKKKLVEIKENIVSSKKRFQELVEEGVSLEEQIKTMNRSINADILTEYEILNISELSDDADSSIYYVEILQSIFMTKRNAVNKSIVNFSRTYTFNVDSNSYEYHWFKIKAGKPAKEVSDDKALKLEQIFNEYI